MAWWLPSFLLLLAGGSLWIRVKDYRTSSVNETKTSPLSLAVQDLVAAAGGIYIAIFTLTSFIKLDMPEKITLFQTSVDPLAFSAVGMAIIQPLFFKAINKLIRR
jgi:hypothetical protein